MDVLKLKAETFDLALKIEEEVKRHTEVVGPLSEKIKENRLLLKKLDEESGDVEDASQGS